MQQLSLGASFQRQELDLDLSELLGEGGDKDREKVRWIGGLQFVLFEVLRVKTFFELEVWIDSVRD